MFIYYYNLSIILLVKMDKNNTKTRKEKDQRTVRVQQLKSGQLIITLPHIVARDILVVKKGDRLKFEHFMGEMCLRKLKE